MKASDLRIGSIVSHDDYSSDVFRVKSIISESNGEITVDTFGGKNGSWINNITLITPVPITELLLMQFGFESKVEDGLLAYKFNLKNFCISFPDFKDDPECCTYVYDDGGINPIESVPLIIDMLYAHQLQNVFYAITGEELIKL